MKDSSYCSASSCNPRQTGWCWDQGSMGAVLSFPGLLVLLHAEVFNDIEVVVLLKNTFGASHFPFWWYCMMDSFWLDFSDDYILILTKSPTPFAEMQPKTCKEPPPCFTAACRHSLLYCSPATNCLLLQPYFQIMTSVQNTCCYFHAQQFPCFCA